MQGVQEETYTAIKQRGIERASRTLDDLQVVRMGETDHDIPLHRPEPLARLRLDIAGRRSEG